MNDPNRTLIGRQSPDMPPDTPQLGKTGKGASLTGIMKWPESGFWLAMIDRMSLIFTLTSTGVLVLNFACNFAFSAQAV